MQSDLSICLTMCCGRLSAALAAADAPLLLTDGPPSRGPLPPPGLPGLPTPPPAAAAGTTPDLPLAMSSEKKRPTAPLAWGGGRERGGGDAGGRAG